MSAGTNMRIQNHCMTERCGVILLYQSSIQNYVCMNEVQKNPTHHGPDCSKRSLSQVDWKPEEDDKHALSPHQTYRKF